ncbi:DUF4428 domain-containing protein [Liquorilactobacillus satsumensis]|uniref:DUF4428 domain-containing protein n=1 Tax=Liquorilactobacillus satsumensis TaxID=259059 RepID=UPI001E52C735|nr:DUF4428 domain-containing protein [Liquorilactobacillus satsumensis]MCC7666758.1 hypothetical protein [Liquorilactobacillus satsumensis]MCP9357633.1 DUF4428 domain-containing protein [Liquorilactobacillus satsumensis]MCP9371927.1 DUF4428 domain-containing protein [Liquorilactobacillus satsumensis]
MQKTCALCNEKISLFSPKISFKDGAICKKCFSKTSLTGSYSDLLWARSKTINGFKNLMQSGEQIDTKAEIKSKKAAEDAKHKEAKEFVRNLPDNTKTIGGVAINAEQSKKRVRKPFGALVCPHCKSANIQILEKETNTKTKRTTSIDLNPLHPLTAFDHHEKKIKKKKLSGKKALLAVSTGGTSAMVPGVGLRTKNKQTQYQCRECGKVWTGK